MYQTITACPENCSGQTGGTYTSVTRDAYLALKGNEVCMRVFMFGIQHYWVRRTEL
jgi:hypothetical protein